MINKVSKFLGFFISLIVGLLLCFIIAFHLPLFQAKLIRNVVKFAATSYSCKINYKDCYVSLFSRSYFKDVYIETPEGKKLALSISFDLKPVKSLLKLSFVTENIDSYGEYFDQQYVQKNESFKISCDRFNYPIIKKVLKFNNLTLEASDNKLIASYLKASKESLLFSLIDGSRVGGTLFSIVPSLSYLNNSSYSVRGEFIFSNSYKKVNVRDFNIALNDVDNSVIAGDLEFFYKDSLLDDLEFNIKVKEANIGSSCLEQYPISPINKAFLGKLGTLSFTGETLGTISDFKIKLNTKTDLGDFSVNGKFGIDLQKSLIGYAGDIELKNALLNIYEVVHSEPIIASLNAYIAESNFSFAEGTNWNSLFVRSNIDVSSISFKNKIYKKLKLTCDIDKSKAFGEFIIDDEKVSMLGTYEYNFLDKNSLRLKTTMNRISLEDMGLIDYPGTMSIKSLNFFAIKTSAGVLDTEVVVKDMNIKLQSTAIKIQDGKLGLHRDKHNFLAALDTDFCKASVKYHSSKSLSQIFSNKKFINDKADEIVYELIVKDLAGFLPKNNFYITPGAKIWGKLGHLQKSLYSSGIDSLRVNNYSIEGLKFFLETDLANKTSLEILHLSTLNQKINNLELLQSLNIKVLPTDIKNGFAVKIDIDNQEATLLGNYTFLNENICLKLKDFYSSNKDESWLIHDKNSIIINSSSICLSHVEFTNAMQHFSLDGRITSNREVNLHCKLKNISIHKKSGVGGSIKFDLNGSIKALKEKTTSVFKTDILVKELIFNDYTLGDLFIKTSLNTKANKLALSANLLKEGVSIAKLDGHYSNGFNLNLSTNGLPLLFTNYFFKEVIEEIDGKLYCTLQIKGDLDKIDLLGNISIKSGAFKIVYLNTKYYFDTEVNLDKNQAYIDSLECNDGINGKGSFKGNIDYSNINFVSIYLFGSVDNIQLVNTSSYEFDEYFYGTGFASGNIEFSGPLNALNIKIKASTEKGTNIVVNVDSPALVEEDFIKYVNNGTDGYNKTLPDNPSPVWLPNLYLELDINSNATQKITFNKTAKDTIVGRGQGKLNVFLIKNKPFEIEGFYEFIEGKYSLDIYNLISKKFDILAGSKINFLKSLEEINLDIKSVYKQRVSLKPIINLNENTNINYDTNCNVDVIVNVVGNVYRPRYVFSINISDYQNTDVIKLAINNFKQKITTDDIYLHNQIFNIIMLKTLVNTDQMISMDNTGRTISDILSRQLSEFLSNVNENVIIDFELDGVNQKSFFNPNVNLGYKFANGNLVVNKKTTLGKELDAKNILLNDWLIDYTLTKDKKIKLTLNVNPLRNKNSIGLMFSSLEDIFKRKTNK
jgi:hypothetical protein